MHRAGCRREIVEVKWIDSSFAADDRSMKDAIEVRRLGMIAVEI
jgi:hypothetical protein